MNRTQKQEFVAKFKEIALESQLIVVTQYSGLNVAEISAMRAKVRDASASYKVTKNRLTKLALQDTNFANLSDMLVGPTGLAISKDPVSAAKAVVEFAKTNDKLKVIGGSLNGELLGEKAIKELASLPSLDELRGKLVGIIQAPAQRLATVTQAPLSKLARVFDAYATK